MSAYGLRHVRFCARYGVIDACNLCLHVKMSSFLHKNSVKIVTVELVDLKCKFVVLLSVHVHDPRKIHVDLHIYLIKPLCLYTALLKRHRFFFAFPRDKIFLPCLCRGNETSNIFAFPRDNTSVSFLFRQIYVTDDFHQIRKKYYLGETKNYRVPPT